ncbi:GNAT family N-acetyltransferase [Inmirania thermothiophila]|uniref:tRNA(Met) cytidine acetyltransferase TmcA n=1 Tax=Inmirania thermothiophila TaxID=1750597 RepID=A0A3N1Y7C7_9GAMM|nr:GNAT family N-acetyltransferase [Inmirania thermothiophila]ROR34428.1 tRNA(Met)-cytidine N(4)-acetyltransferase [Inmirania thermothiophila]
MEAATAWARALMGRLAAARHRRAVLLAGGAAWGRGTAAAMARAAGDALWIGAQPPAGLAAAARGQAAGHLGGEHDAVVVDLHEGFDPDLLGMAAGMVRGPGLLLLPAPPPERWPVHPDPERARIAVAGYGPEAVAGRFLARLARISSAHPGVIVVREGGGLPPLPAPPPDRRGEASPDPDCLSADQAAAVAALLRTAEGGRRRPAVLVADRGRGKSAALGICAARLAARGRAVVITAPRPEAAATALRHAAARLGVAAGRALAAAGVRFLPPDALVRRPQPGAMVLVDEAAALPGALLAALLAAHPRIGFATTVHGYEGSGRGFALRFLPAVEAASRGARVVRLQQPVRWGAEDALEAWLFRALLLDAEPAPLPPAAACAPAIAVAGRDALAADEALLAQVFGLLVSAHYRTRPYDLRYLLDGPNLHVLLAREGAAAVGVVLLAEEGGFDADAARAVWAGVRRPHGHLVPETLAAHLGLEAAARLRWGRIVRIAVHPARRRRGIGRALVEAARREACARGWDGLGASFGATPGLVAFWSRAGLRPARVSVRRGAASGEHSVLMLEGLSGGGRDAVEAACVDFGRGLPRRLADPLRGLEPELAAALLGAAGPARWEAVGEAAWAQAAAFAWGRRIYEEAQPALAELLPPLLGDPATAPAPPQAAALVAKVLQGRPWPEVAGMLGVPGRAQAAARLREALRPALEARGGEAVRAVRRRLRDAGA